MTTTTQRLKQTQSSSIISSSDHRPTVVLCSSKDDHLLSQDICTLCGSIGKGDEGNLISCSQCGQCYHPYCVNIKGLKVVISKGWRCLECTVCETCGQPGDEAKLLLCDECELSCHTYCLNPPLEDVPQGAWKCHWCVVCQRCKSHSPGINSDWQKNYTYCGPCSSRHTCPKCKNDYNSDDLIIECSHCSRWLHASCDSIRDAEECELAIEIGYTCLLCRPKDDIPLYMVRRKSIDTNNTCTMNNRHDAKNSQNHDTKSLLISSSNNKDIKFNPSANGPYPNMTKHLQQDFPRPQSAPLSSSSELNSPCSIKRPASSLHFTSSDVKANGNFSISDDINHFDAPTVDENAKPPTKTMDDLLQDLHMIDGVYLSEVGFNYIKAQKLEPAKRQRAKRSAKGQKLDDCNIMDETNRDDDEENKLINDDKTDEEGRKKRVRKLSKLGVGGFSVRQRGVRLNKDDDFNFSLSNDATEASTPPPPPLPPPPPPQAQTHSAAQQQSAQDQTSEMTSNSKPKRIRKKPKKKSHLIDQYPSYLQEAFFGKPLLSVNEIKSTDEKYSETLYDCSNMDLQLEGDDLPKSTTVTDSTCRSTTSNKLISNSKFSDNKNEFVDESVDGSKMNDARELNKEGDLMDVLIGDAQTGYETSESKKDNFDPDLLSTDFNLDMVDPLDSKVVEDLLNGLSTQQSSSQTMDDSNTVCNPSPQSISPSIRPMTETANHYENSPQQIIPVQTPSPRVQFCRPPPQQHSMIQVSKVRPPSMDINRLQAPDPYSIPPSTPRPMPIQQRSPFSPQSPFPPHPNTVASSTPPITPRTPNEHQSIYPSNQHVPMTPNQSQHQQPPPLPQQQQQPAFIEPPQARIQQQSQYQQVHQPHYSSQQPMEAQKASQNWESEEALGPKATKSAVLYANLEHPNLRQEYRSADERFKQIQKLWRQLPADKRKPYVEKARENRSAMKVSKPPSDNAPAHRKAESPLQHQPKPMMHHENMHLPPQQVHMGQSPMVHQSQDTRWRQPMTMEGQSNRFLHSPQSHLPPSHMSIDSGAVCNPPQSMSPAVRTMTEPATHFEHSPQQMMPPQTPSPQMQFARPPSHSMIQVSRVRPPSIDPNRMQNSDPYAIPPSTPRPMPIQQRSPFSPQSPFPSHPGNTASSTPPITPRTPNELQSIYPQNQHMPMAPNQSQQHQQPPPQQQQQQPAFVEPHQTHMQQPNQYQQIRPPHYANQQRMVAPMQYNNQMSGSPALRGPMNQPQRAPQMQVQQPVYQPAQYRQDQPVRYANQHQDPHQHMSSPMQQNVPPQQMHQQRIQGPIMARQVPQMGHQGTRMINQPRHQHQMMPGQATMHQIQQQPHQLPHSPMHQQQHIQQQQQQQQPIQSQPVQHHAHQPQLQQQHHPQQQTVTQPQSHTQQIHYANVQVNQRIDPDDPVQLLEDEDALKDLGADFNILEFADPEPDKGASTSAGKNNIDLDPEFEDFFDDREPLDEKRSNEHVMSVPGQQQSHQVQQQPSQQQMIYQPMHSHQQVVQNQTFVEGQQHHGMQQQQNQYSAQRQPHFINQQRVMTPSNQQYAPNQPQLIRAQQMPGSQVRMQHPQQQQQQPQQQMTYVQQRPQHPSRYQSPMAHEMHQQHMPQQMQQQQQQQQPQPVMHQPQQINSPQLQRGPQMQPQHQYHPQQPNFIDNQQQAPGNHMHIHHHHQQQQQYSQSNMMYGNHQQHNQQMNPPRRQFQPPMQQQQNYTYQQQPQHQGNYQQIACNQQQQMMKTSNEAMLHDKSPIIGEPITSMEFTMYEQGSGSNNEAVNLPMQTSESHSLRNPNQDSAIDSSENSAVSQNRNIGFEQDTIQHSTQSVQQESAIMPPISQQQQTIEINPDIHFNNSSQDTSSIVDNSFKFSSGRLSSCSNPQESESSQSASQLTSTSERPSGGSQAQNQLLKQLLATCSSADSPNQESSSSHETVSKGPMTPSIHSVVPKQVSSGIPTISFQMDSTHKTTSSIGSIISNSQQITGPQQIRAKNVIGPTFQPQPKPPSIPIAASTSAPNFEIKAYNVGQQVQPSVSVNMAPIVRVQQLPPQVSSAPMVQIRAEGQIISRSDPTTQQQNLKQPDVTGQSIVSLPSPKIADPTVKSQIVTENQAQLPVSTASSNLPISISLNESHSAPSAKAKRKSDYMAKRRADLEKEPTPPPREVKPKKRVRGPNKRSRGENNDDTKVIDSNSNTSETSQLHDNSQGAPPRKRVRKSQKAKTELENSESLLSSLANKIQNELPVLSVQEPDVKINNNLGSIFACGDLNSISSKLRGPFGKGALVSGPPNGTLIKKGEHKSVGYYHDEFPKELDNSIDIFNSCVPRILERDCDSPGSIISSSSLDYEDALDLDLESNDTRDHLGTISFDFNRFYTPDLNKFKSPKKIIENSRTGHLEGNSGSEDGKDINNNARPMSPSIPIDIKLPTAHVSISDLSVLDHENDDNNKENRREIQTNSTPEPRDICQTSDQTSTSLSMRLKDGNVSVTLTLTNEEADGVKRVLNKLSELIEPPPSSCVMENAESSNHNQDKSSLSNSLRLLTSAPNSNSVTGYSSHNDLKFNELNYVPMETDEGNDLTLSKASSELVDVKPELCCRCKAIIVDRGIRKNISEIPELTRSSMRKSSIIGENQTGELVFCSVNCYAMSIMSKSSGLGNQDSSYSPVKAPQVLPPISPMMEDDEDDLCDSNRFRESDKKGVLEKSFPNRNSTDVCQKRRWADIRYIRWTPSFFESNKSTSPISSDDMSTVNENTSQCSSSQLINHGDSSVDSNESDNSTSYSQSTSGKIANNLDDPLIGVSNHERQLSTSNHYNGPRDSVLNKDVITPWPEGMDLIQVKPIKPIKRNIKGEPGINEPSQKEGIENSPSESIEMYEDTRKCVLCHEYGDGDSDGPARLLNLFIDGWVHLNCALWSLDVYELANGALMNVELACRKAMACSLCHKPGATLKCFKPRCPNYYHFLCARKEECSFYEDKSVQCRQHSKSSVKEMTSFVVKRRVYVNRDEQKQVAEMIQGEQQNVMRIGSLVFLNIGQLLPHQLMAFHDQNNIFPVGYKVIRYYWSFRQFNKRCKYLCTIEDNDGKPQFRIIAQELNYGDEEFVGDSPQSVWNPIINMIVRLREGVSDTITTFPAYIRGIDLFGLNEPSIVRILESLPGVESLTDYDFKFGRSPLLELPLAINPTGCARTEPKLRTHLKRPYTIHTASSVPKSRLQSLSSGDSSSPYIKQFVHSKSSQYRKMKSEWRNNVVLARSRVQGLGLYAARDIEKHTMVIEYIGMLIRNEIAERYEKIHEAHVSNR